MSVHPATADRFDDVLAILAAYVGTTAMFERAGFRRALETGARSDHRPRWLMRLELSSPPGTARPSRGAAG